MKQSNSIGRMFQAQRAATCGIAAIRALSTAVYVANVHVAIEFSAIAKYQSECAAHAAFLAYPHLRDTFPIGYGNIV